MELLEDDSLPEIEDMKDGDRDYPSSHEAMQTLDSRVYKIYMDFE